ncbi:MAG: sigma 54-interacting transcriptional regulator [Deltaproteobacteria bacterium]|nr:sigma 54-interacting transcriptional regulator [Deltaproteobacteria bacterium]
MTALSQPELAALLAINQALARHRQRAPLFAAIADALQSVLPADRVVVLVPEAQGTAVYAVRHTAKLAAGERLPAGSLPAWVMRERRPGFVASPQAAREHFPATAEKLSAEGMQSAAVLPLLVGERCIGALSMMAASPDAFAAVSSTLLEQIAGAVAVALDTCLTYEQLERLGQERQALLDLNAAIGRHLERDELFGAMAVCLRNLVPTERFGIELPIEGERLQGHLLTPRDGAAQPTVPTVLPAAGTACDWVLRHRRWVVIGSRAALREDFPVTYEVMGKEGMESLVAMPLISGDHCPGVLFFMAARRDAYADLRREFLDQVAGAVAVALDDCLAHEEVRRLRDRLAQENVYLQEEIQQDHHFGEIVGRSPALREVLGRVDKVAPADATVLILGETGTGKELIARAIHDRSPRRERPLVKLNCSALAAGLVESELFGHVRGAFTGALADRVGRFALADGGTLFLDEIGELPMETQVKLLRVLQEREFEPVGSNRTRRVDVRVIAATNRDLQAEVAAGRFRSDLYFRISVLPIQLPPLRARRDDIPLLVHFFVQRFARQMGKRIDAVPRPTMERLAAYAWPGNVRELQNVIERAMVLSKGPLLEVGAEILPAAAPPPSIEVAVAVPAHRAPTPPTNLEDVGRQHMQAVLERCNWVIEGPRGAAQVLGLQPSTLRSRMKKLGLSTRARA